jgi:hypothetical protein
MDTANALSTARNRRRSRFQFTLRHVVAGVAVAAISISLLASRVHTARREARAVAAVRELGGSVSGGTGVDDWFPWLLRLFGVEHLGAVDDVHLIERPSLRESDVAVVAQFTHLRRLVFCKSRVTDDALAHLETLTDLEYLDLDSTRVTDAGLDHLKSLHNLRCLSLTGTEVSDHGADALNDQLPYCRIYRIRQDGGKPRWLR